MILLKSQFVTSKSQFDIRQLRCTILVTPKYLIIKSRFLNTVRLGMRTSHPSLINFSYIGILNLYEGKISSPRKIHFT
jgi:hypothetical protein